MLISVVVPVYNSQNYLEKCLDSIRSQSFQDWECILVDDGSTDDCGTIIDSFVKKDARFVSVHKRNGGVSSARNVGIASARGEYIAFIDSDDWVADDYLELLYNAVRIADCDLSVCGFGRVGRQGIIIPHSVDTSISLRINKENESLFVELNQKCLLYGPCKKLYKSSIIKNNGLSFDETCSYGEDLLFNYCYLGYVNRINVLNRILYFYRETGENSLSGRIRPDWFDINYSQWKVLRRFFEERFGDSELSKGYLYRRLWGIVYDSVFLYPRLPQRSLNYLKRILSIPEINELRLYDDFPCSKWISVSILNRWFLVFYLYFNLKR